MAELRLAGREVSTVYDLLDASGLHIKQLRSVGVESVERAVETLGLVQRLKRAFELFIAMSPSAPTYSELPEPVGCEARNGMETTLAMFRGTRATCLRHI